MDPVRPCHIDRLERSAASTKVAQTVTSWGDTAIDFTAVLGALTPGGLWLYVTNDSDDVSDGFPVTVHRAVAIELAASTHIGASGANTTARLTAPSSKTTGDFDAGRIQDDENPADAINITDDDYTEIEWSIQATADAEEAAYLFRVVFEGAVLDTYTVTPQITVVSSTPVATTLVAPIETLDTAARSVATPVESSIEVAATRAAPITTKAARTSTVLAPIESSAELSRLAVAPVSTSV